MRVDIDPARTGTVGVTHHRGSEVLGLSSPASPIRRCGSGLPRIRPASIIRQGATLAERFSIAAVTDAFARDDRQGTLSDRSSILRRLREHRP